MSKSPEAFRTISEVADILGTPAHVLRFWESKFSQIKPVKRAGGRRYYRPQDIALLTGIKHLLHEQGMTIKGAQKLLREQGVKHVANLVDTNADTNADKALDVPAPDLTQPLSDNAPEAETPPIAPPAPVTPSPENVVGFTAMPPPTPAPELPQQTPAALQAEPLLPREAATPAEPRLFAALLNADKARLQLRATEIAPLISRLETLRNRLSPT